MYPIRNFIFDFNQVKINIMIKIIKGKSTVFSVLMRSVWASLTKR